MNIRRKTHLTMLQALVVASTVAATTGCMVLTERQVAAVNQFADATKGFGTSPAAVITAHAELRKERGLIEASTRNSGKVAARDLDNALRQEAGLTRLAASSEAAMGVLDDYAQMLGVLSSSQFTDDLQNNAVELGTSIDNGIGTFNRIAGANVGSFGDIVAGIVRAGGGIWVRYEQRKALAEAVKRADPAVDHLTKAIEELMDAYLPPSSATAESLSLFSSEADDVRSMVVRSTSGRQFMLQQAQAALHQARDGEALAASCKSAAAQYRAAHKQLVQAIASRDTDLSGLTAQIQVLAEEIKAGKRVRDDVKNARND